MQYCKISDEDMARATLEGKLTLQKWFKEVRLGYDMEAETIYLVVEVRELNPIILSAIPVEHKGYEIKVVKCI